MVVAYDGRAYHGWQKQKSGTDTVQQQVEIAAVDVLKHPVVSKAASRTDSGVHAEGQVVCIETDKQNIPLAGIRCAINSRLPFDIMVRSAREVPVDFDPTRDAVGKTYRYTICISPRVPVSLAGNTWRYGRPLDIEPMREAARMLAGEHDFAGFASRGDDRECTIRRIFACDVIDWGIKMEILIRGNGFLYHMVRNIAGTLVEIGRGRWKPERIREILVRGDRSLAGPTAPPEGLSLLCVHYNRDPCCNLLR